MLLFKRLSDREYLLLHAEIKALQRSLGISYKDAAHRLYMAEIAKLNKSASAQEYMMRIQNFIDRLMVKDIDPVVRAIDNLIREDLIMWNNGKWTMKY